MTERTIDTTIVNMGAKGSVQIPAYLAKPVDTGLYPAIVVLEEIFGINLHSGHVAYLAPKEPDKSLQNTIPS